ncbi:MAG: type II secretion system protein [Desulfurivibrionaceae bacterium]
MKTNQGFTLIEVITTIVVVTLASLTVVIFLNGMVTRSGKAVSLVRDLALAREPLEEMTEEYGDYANTKGAGSNATWREFKEDLQDIEDKYEDQGLEVNSTNSTLDPSPDFEVIEVTAAKGEHTVAALFSK